jgi:phenylacetate-CoA ligase
LLRTQLLPAFNMSERQLERYVARIRQYRPRMLFGYASAIAMLAGYAEDRGIDLTGLGVRVAFVTGETLYPTQRALISRVFAAPVANGYGSRDAGFIAHECPQGSLHVSAEHIIVELLDQAGAPVAPGEQGEIVTTHLATGDFPFVRYRTGDMAIASAEPCSCGRGLPVLREVLGRSSDFIRTANGTVMHALAMIYEVRDVPGVVQFKFIQSADLAIELQIVTDARFASAADEKIRAGIQARLGAGASFAIRHVAEIAPERSGKYRYVVSHAAASQGGS